MAIAKKPTAKKAAPKKKPAAPKIIKSQYEAMNALFLWAYNYDHNFIDKVWGEGSVMSNHLNAKFNGLYKRHGANAVGMAFVAELDTENRAKLFAYIIKRHKR